MLMHVGNGTALVVCTTCRVSEEDWDDAAGRRGGELFLEALQAALVGHPAEGALALQPMACLFACTSHCTVHLRAPGKMGYLLGRFSPTRVDARALLDYAAAYLQSQDGVVRFSDWPDGIKGRFIARLPPEGLIWIADPIS